MTADLRGQEAELLLDFLATAPEPLRDWAERQAADVRAGAEAAAPQVPTVKPSPSGLAPSDEALAELGEVDDDAVRRPRIHTPMDKESTPVAPKSRRRRPLVGLVAVALVGALVYGIFRIGQPATSAEPAPETSVTTAQPDEAARMLELEATLANTPDDVGANLELGVLRFNAGDTSGAEQLWLRVTELDPANPQAWFNLGFVALAADPPDLVAARAAWDRVLEVAPDSDLAATVSSHLDALETAGTPSAPASQPESSGKGG